MSAVGLTRVRGDEIKLVMVASQRCANAGRQCSLGSDVKMCWGCTWLVCVHLSAECLTLATAGCAVLKFCRNVSVVGDSGSAPMSVLEDGDSRLPCMEVKQTTEVPAWHL